MKTAVAVRTYLQAEPNGTPVTARELADTFKGMPQEEKDALGREACDLLGETWEPSSGG